MVYNDRMRRFVILFLTLAAVSLFSAPPSRAQTQSSAPSDTSTSPQALGEVVQDPVCFKLRSDAPYTVFGTVITNFYVDAQGRKARHRSNFHLKQGESSEFCTYGPFYEGRKLELVLRTLVPVFTCKTKIDGDIIIHGQMNTDGSTKSWAECGTRIEFIY